MMKGYELISPPSSDTEAESRDLFPVSPRKVIRKRTSTPDPGQPTNTLKDEVEALKAQLAMFQAMLFANPGMAPPPAAAPPSAVSLVVPQAVMDTSEVTPLDTRVVTAVAIGTPAFSPVVSPVSTPETSPTHAAETSPTTDTPASPEKDQNAHGGDKGSTGRTVHLATGWDVSLLEQARPFRPRPLKDVAPETGSVYEYLQMDRGPCTGGPRPIPLEMDPRLSFLGTPSLYQKNPDSKVLRKVRQEARTHPDSRRVVRQLPLGIVAIHREEEAVTPSGKYTSRSTWVENPAFHASQGWGSHQSTATPSATITDLDLDMTNTISDLTQATSPTKPTNITPDTTQATSPMKPTDTTPDSTQATSPMDTTNTIPDLTQATSTLDTINTIPDLTQVTSPLNPTDTIPDITPDPSPMDITDATTQDTTTAHNPTTVPTLIPTPAIMPRLQVTIEVQATVTQMATETQATVQLTTTEVQATTRQTTTGTQAAVDSTEMAVQATPQTMMTGTQTDVE
jgi:hypothetical protein